MTQEERIDRYFSGEMDDLERLAFDKELMNDPKLAGAVKEHRSIVSGLKSYGLQQKLRSIMSTDEEIEEPEPELPTHRLKLWLAILLGTILLAAGYMWLNTSDNQKPEEKLYMAYYYPEPGLPTTMSGDADRSFNQAMSEYKKGEYRSALNQFLKLRDKTGTSEELVFYTGMCQQATGDLKHARMSLEHISKSSKIYPKTLWYLALIELKSGDTALAQQRLLSLSKIENPTYSKKANELLNELNQAK